MMISFSILSEALREAFSILRINIRHAFNFGSKSSIPVFILGSGRSGTHFLAQTLIKNPDMDDLTGGKENPAVFYKVTKCALGQRKGYQDVVLTYRKMLNLCNKNFFVDQTHPNLWFVESLAKNFPNAKFIGISRRPESVIYSTMNHKGTSGWIRNWEKLPFPSVFMGTVHIEYEEYKELDFVEKSALKWMAHNERMEKVCDYLGDKFLHVEYDELSKNTSAVLERIDKFIGVDSPTPMPKVQNESLRKWENMDSEDLCKIKRMCGEYNEEK